MKRLITLLSLVILAQVSFGQTTLISPTGDGGFETGTTFIANGWTVVNHTTNTWQVGAVPVTFAGANCAYISNDGGISWAYTNSISQTSHFYRDIVVPSGETVITLSFQWKGNGESGWDRLLIYAAPTSVTPVAGVPASNSTTLTGATLVFTQATFPQAAYILATVTLPGSLAGGTFRLIFTWQNDGSFGTNPPVALDNISLTSQAPATYTWLATSGSASWATAASWSPARTTPAASDILVFNAGGSSTATSIPTQTVGRISVSNNTTINLQAAVTSTLTISSDGTSADELSVASGSTLMSDGSTAALTLTYSGSGSTGNIAGTMEITSASGTIANTFNFAGGTTPVTTVSGTLANGQSGGTGVPIITASATALVFTSTGTYIHKFATSNGTIPTATWNAASNCNIIGYTGTNMNPSGSAQTFGNFTWNCTGQGTNNYNLSLTSTTFNVAGTFYVLSTGTTGSLRLGGTGSYSANIGNLVVSGGILDLQSGVSGTPSLNVSGSLTQSSPGFIQSSATSTGNPTLNFNGATNQAITFATQPTGPITFRISNPLGITLSAPFTNFVFGNGTLGGLRISTTFATPITLAGSLTTLDYNAANSTLTYDAAGFLTASSLIFPATNGPTSLTVNLGAGYNLTLPFDRTLSNTLTMSSGDIIMGINTLTLGTSTTVLGTLSGSSGAIIGNFKRWFSNVTGSKDFLVGIPGTQRKATINFTVAPTTGGTLTTSFVPTDPGTAGLPLTEGAINVNTASKSGYWKIDAGDGLAGGTYTGTFTATNFPGVNSFAGLVLIKRPSGGGNWVLDGTHVTTTGSNTVPVLSRTGMTSFSEFGVGGDAANNPMSGTSIFSITTGNWGDISTWSTNTVPTSGDNVSVSAGHTVTTAGGSPPYFCLNLTIAATGVLNVSGNDITIAGILTNNGTFNCTGSGATITGGSATGITNAATTGTFTVSGGTVTLGPAGGSNRTFTNNGTLTVSGTGTLNINGNFVNTSSVGNIFTQSGGNINVDGNAAGVAANSVASGTNLVTFSSGTPTTVFFTGGTFTIVDPHASSTSSYALSGGMSTATNCSLSHTFVFGDGVSNDPAPGGFLVYLFPGSSYLILGNVIINGTATMDRFVGLTSTVGILGNITINGYGELRTSSVSNYYTGNITVNSNGILTNPNVVNLASYANATVTPATVPQTISGAGYFRNLLPTASVSAGGTGYVVGDILTVVGGTFTSVAKFVVSTVSSGAVSTVTAIGYANYSVAPTTPAATTGGTGTGCTLTTLTNLTPTASMSSLTVNNTNATGVTLGGPLSLSGTLTLTTGLLNTTATNLLTLGTATLAGTLSGGSATAYIIGPFARTFAASRTASGTFTTATLFPVGKGTSYLPVWIDPSTSSVGPVVFKGEAFISNPGSAGSGVTGLSTNRWETLISSGSGNFLNSYLMIGDAGIGSTNQILQANAAAGVYGAIPVASVYTAGTPNTLKTGSAILAASFNGYFAYGNLTPCIVPGAQPTGFTVSFKTTTGFTGSFTPPFPPPSNYLVVRYASGAAATPPVDYTAYTVGGSLGTGTVRSISTSNNFIETGLSAGITYDYYTYSYNNSGCYGPVYLTSSPLFASVTTCSAVVGVPGTPTSSAVTTSSFTATWGASTTLGVNYLLDVSTVSTFTSFVSGYAGKNVGSNLSENITGLSVATTYYVRVRAVDNSVSCYSVYSGTLTQATACNAEIAPTIVQDFSTYLGNAPEPVCWSEATGTLAASSVLTYVNSEWTSSTGFANTGTNKAVRVNLYTTGNDWIISQPIDLGVTPGLFRVKYNMAVTSFLGTIAQSTLGTHKVDIVVSTDGGTTWSNSNIIKEYTGVGTYSNTGQIELINLTAYSGIVKIAFVETTSSSSPDIDFHIDDFQVEAIPASPAITVNPTSLAFGYTPSGGTSSELTYTLSGQFLTPASGNITITPPANFEVSLTTGTGFSASPITVAYSGGILAATTIYAIFKPTTPSTPYSGNIANSGGGAPTQNVAVTGTSVLTYCTPTYSLGGTTDFVTQVTLGTLSQATTSNVTPYYIDYTATQNAVPDLEQGSSANSLSLTFSSDGTQYNGVWIDFDKNGTFATSEFFTSGTNAGSGGTAIVTIAVPGGATLGNTRMRIRGGEDSQLLATHACGASSSSYGQAQDYLVNIVLATSPNLAVVPTSLNFGTIPSGSTSSELTYTLSGSNLTPSSGNITITPPANFEVSLTTGSGFSASPINVPYSGGTLASTTIYVVFKPTSPSTVYSGNISNAGGGATTVNVAVTGTSTCGAVTIPYTQNFDAVTAPAIPNCWTVTNDNGDGVLWVTSTAIPRSAPNSMRISYNGSLAMNDWFFSPPITLAIGTYKVSFWYRNSGVTFPEKLEVKWGSTPNAGGMTNGPIFDNNNITTTTYVEGTGNLTVTSAGDYYVGWHGYSVANMFYLLVDDISITQVLAHDVSTISIDMLDIYAPGAVTPQATVKNEGANTETFPVTMTIGSYTSTQTVTALAPGATQLVTFASWTAATGSYTINVCTGLASPVADMNNANDCISQEVRIFTVPNKQVYGYNAFAGSGTDLEGPTTFNLSSPGVLNAITDQSTLNFVSGGTWANGIWYGNVYSDNTFISIDPSTGVRTVIGSMGVGMEGISYNLSDGIMYGVNGVSLYTINMSTGLATQVGSSNSGIGMVNLAINAAGIAYAIDLTNDVLGTVNLTTGLFTPIGSIGFNGNYAQDMEFDRETGELYVAAQDFTSGWLALANTATGNILKIGDFEGGAEITGFAIPYITGANLWTGNISNDWNTIGNWGAGHVPYQTEQVTIPTTPAGGRFPNVANGIAASCFEVILQSGATITVQSGGSLYVVKP